MQVLAPDENARGGNHIDDENLAEALSILELVAIDSARRIVLESADIYMIENEAQAKIANTDKIGEIYRIVSEPQNRKRAGG